MHFRIKQTDIALVQIPLGIKAQTLKGTKAQRRKGYK
jgi:hypothetical protein